MFLFVIIFAIYASYNTEQLKKNEIHSFEAITGSPKLSYEFKPTNSSSNGESFSSTPNLNSFYGFSISIDPISMESQCNTKS